MEQVDIPIYLYEIVYKYKSIWGCWKKTPQTTHKKPPPPQQKQNNNNHTTPEMAQKIWFSISEETFRENCAVEDQANP